MYPRFFLILDVTLRPPWVVCGAHLQQLNIVSLDQLHHKPMPRYGASGYMSFTDPPCVAFIILSYHLTFEQLYQSSIQNINA